MVIRTDSGVSSDHSVALPNIVTRPPNQVGVLSVISL